MEFGKLKKLKSEKSYGKWEGGESLQNSERNK